jgi:hypothetical protein
MIISKDLKGAIYIITDIFAFINEDARDGRGEG